MSCTRIMNRTWCSRLWLVRALDDRLLVFTPYRLLLMQCPNFKKFKQSSSIILKTKKLYYDSISFADLTTLLYIRAYF